MNPTRPPRHRCFLSCSTWVLLIPSRDGGRFFRCPEIRCGKQDSAPSGWSRKAHAVHSHDLPQPVEITVCTRAWRVTQIFHVHTAAAQLLCASAMVKECLWPECCCHRSHKHCGAKSEGEKKIKRHFPTVFKPYSWFQMKLLGISA